MCLTLDLSETHVTLINITSFCRQSCPSYKKISLQCTRDGMYDWLTHTRTHARLLAVRCCFIIRSLCLFRMWTPPCWTDGEEDSGRPYESPGPVAVAVLTAEWSQWTHLWLCAHREQVGSYCGSLLWGVREHTHTLQIHTLQIHTAVLVLEFLGVKTLWGPCQCLHKNPKTTPHPFICSFWVADFNKH